MSGGRRRALAIALFVVLIGGGRLSAHRLDEYLQAARIAIEPDGAQLDLDLTPGIAVADRIIADVDGDRDGSVSAAEQRAYVARVLGGLELEVDGRPLRLQSTAAAFPGLDALRRGDASIHLQSRAVLPPLAAGRHKLRFRNLNDADVSVYLANALVPESDRVAVTAQQRDASQTALTIDFITRSGSATSTSSWLLGSLGTAAALAGVLRLKRENSEPRLTTAR